LDILWFNWRDIENPSAGGAEIYTHEIAKRLVKRGNSVTLFTSAFNGCKRKSIIDGVEVVREGGEYSVYRKAKSFYRRRGDGYDIVIDEINTKPFDAPKFVRCKVLALIHQLAREFWMYEMPFPLNYLGFYLEDVWLRKYRTVPTVTVSESTRKDLHSLGFKEVYIVYNGLNVKPLQKLPKKDEKPTIIFVGRMKKAKKPQDVLEAFKIVKDKVKDARLWMVGDGYLRRRLQTKACEDVTFFGYVSKEKLRELLMRA